MDLNLIERLITMLGQSDLQSLDVTEGNLRIRLSKAPPVVESPVVPHPAAGSAMSSVNDGTALEIRAGMSGTFYRAPAPGADPFVVEGRVVSEGDTLALIEAMKMLNPVEAETAGRIVAIPKADGEPVEPGMLLFTLESAS